MTLKLGVKKLSKQTLHFENVTLYRFVANLQEKEAMAVTVVCVFFLLENSYHSSVSKLV